MNTPDSQRASICAALDALEAGQTAPLRAWISGHLFEHVLPFWEKNALDKQGGISTCINDRGEIVSHDKWLWSQWRAVWVFSRIYNQLDRDPRWLDAAQQIATFASRTGWLPDAEGWALLLSREGEVLRGYESAYVDAFAIYGLLELHRASGDRVTLALARRTADAVLEKLAKPHDQLPHFPYPIPPGTRPHGVPMIFSLKLAELGEYTKEPRYLEAAAVMSDSIFKNFYQPQYDLIVERVKEDGRELPGALGSAVVPGHVIENLWFQIHVAQLLGGRPELPAEACRLILRHLEIGWDPQPPGGILLAVDAAGGKEVGWDFADTKLWWPHTEALYALLLGWKLTKDPAFLAAYRRVWEFCLTHFVDWENGEWRQKLSRDGSPITQVVALPVKDPFHLPRSLILQLELLGAE